MTPKISDLITPSEVVAVEAMLALKLVEIAPLLEYLCGEDDGPFYHLLAVVHALVPDAPIPQKDMEHLIKLGYAKPTVSPH